MKYFSLLILTSLFTVPVVLHAQDAELMNAAQFDVNQITNNFFPTNTNLPSGVEEQLTLDMSPTYPRPGQEVVITISSNSTDLAKAKITWRTNSTIGLQQIGATKFTFTMGKLGESKAVNVFVERNDGGVIEQTYFFTPTEVDLIYSADTYTPPFYKGRAWPTHQSTVKVVALPRILDDSDKLIPIDTYTYTWKRDGRVVQDQSGYGKNVFTYTSGLLDENVEISVKVSPLNYRSEGAASIIITPTDPKIVIYEKNPIYGTIFENAISGIYNLQRNEITFEATPFFFDINNLNFSWIMNNQPIENIQKNTEVTFRIEGDATGRSDISARASNNVKILQSAGEQFTLFFEKLNSNQNTEF